MPAEPSAKGARRSLRIGPYAVEAPLTLGSLGSAYRAKGPSGGRSVALKVLPSELSGSIAARDRFQREASRAKKVRSPYVVNVLDFGDASGTWYLAMELVEGATLAEHVQRHGALDDQAARGDRADRSGVSGLAPPRFGAARCVGGQFPRQRRPRRQGPADRQAARHRPAPAVQRGIAGRCAVGDRRSGRVGVLPADRPQRQTEPGIAQRCVRRVPSGVAAADRTACGGALRHPRRVTGGAGRRRAGGPQNRPRRRPRSRPLWMSMRWPPWPSR